jgi:CubicO group peptidase (beta-lactamase class C family)
MEFELPSSTSSRAAPKGAGFAPSRLDRIENWLAELISSGKMAGASVHIARAGQLAFARCAGFANRERKTPMSSDTIVRIKSMTKPVTSVAVMTLFEEGRFQLDDPIARYLPSFTNQRVLRAISGGRLDTVPAERDITFHDLLTHTAGLTYGFMHASAVDRLYREAEVDFQLDSPLRVGPPTTSLAAMVERAASMPLLSQPGATWNYSIATDILGRLIEVISGVDLPTFVNERILTPLGMSDSGFCVPREKISRFASHYAPSETGLALVESSDASRWCGPIGLPSGGGGLVSTALDYMKFCQMFLNKGRFNGVQILSRKSIELMTSNHLAGDIPSMGPSRVDGERFAGVGFGLGLSVLTSPNRAQTLGSSGELGWWGSASTHFWIDPVEDLVVVFLSQLTPSSVYPLRRELRVLVNQALV